MPAAQDRLADPRFWKVMAQVVEREGMAWFNWGATFLSGDEETWQADERVVTAAANRHGLEAAPMLSERGEPIRGSWILKQADPGPVSPAGETGP